MQFGSVLIYVYIAQLLRASERNSVAVGSNPTQANFLYVNGDIYWKQIYQIKPNIFIPLLMFMDSE